MAGISLITQRALAAKTTATELARLLDCTEQHARDLMDDYVFPTAREHAIMRLCANVETKRLRSILDNFGRDYEWRRIPGFERYEASELGQIRRAVAGHGSMPGHVLRPKKAFWGHLFVNIGPEGEHVRPVAVHRAVCWAFHGPAPSPEHIVCHRNDVKSDNRPENLYWGTQQDNANDRIRNTKRKPLRRRLAKTPILTTAFHRTAPIAEISTPATHTLPEPGPETPLQIKKRTKAAMTYRLRRLAEKERNGKTEVLSLGKGVPP